MQAEPAFSHLLNYMRSFAQMEEIMSNSTFGNIFKVTTWGESHGKALGAVIDGCPAGLKLDEKDIQAFLDRRKPGQNIFATPRKEDDSVEILSGVFEGKTTGTPISLVVYNKNQYSKDYSEIAGYYRPGHADLTYDMKYGFRDYRGGGRSSGRETIGRVAGGAIASKILADLGVQITAYTKSIGPVSIDMDKFDRSVIAQNPLNMPDFEAAAKAGEYLERCIRDKNSAGGMIECVIHNLPCGVGEPVFDKLDAVLSHSLMSIGAVKSIEFGNGQGVVTCTGLENNDPYEYDENGMIRKVTNNAGGILGGISDGDDVIFRVAVKPTPSIASTQHTIHRDGTTIDVNINGRHDPVIVPRAVVVVESMSAITLVDMLFASMTSQMEQVKCFFKK